ncbi:hypothetical protein GDO78_016601 [Eleutherodactylus coqui]|uniref:Uncharacterized protein n=1 Tax=Eleutherodactylus coqui TaxID=57060 RepID=A0A8J6EAG5_ELECQ|nr:hypothetical protein GDO78_016601 [Eleutherodactylus coqui]
MPTSPCDMGLAAHTCALSPSRQGEAAVSIATAGRRVSSVGCAPWTDTPPFGRGSMKDHSGNQCQYGSRGVSMSPEREGQ